MTKSWLTALCFLLMANAGAAQLKVLSPEELKAKIVEITTAQNQVMLKDSTQTDVDKLFALYSDDFVYRHDAYGGN